MQAAAVAATLAAAATPTRADSYLETFSGPLNPAVWQLSAGGNGVSITGGELVFTRLTSDNTLLSFVPQLVGNFDVSFRYRLIDWTSTYAGGDRLQLGVVNPLPAAYGHGIGRMQEGYGYHFAFVNGGCCRFSTPTASGSGTLRITRAAGIVTTSFDDGGGWQNLAQSSPDHRDMTLSFSAYIHNFFVAGTSYAIDDFSIRAERFSQPVPEPAAGAMLAAGLATLGWMMRRRRPLPAA
jgi:hypothetical protein